MVAFAFPVLFLFPSLIKMSLPQHTNFLAFALPTLPSPTVRERVGAVGAQLLAGVSPPHREREESNLVY